MATSIALRPGVPAERRFYTGMAIAILAAVLVGFARSFFLRPLFPGYPSPSEPIFYVHGSLFVAWIALFVLQTSLVATGRTTVHRRVGPFGAVLAASMVALGTVVALVAARRPTGFTGVPVPPLQFLTVPLFDMALFALFALFAALAVARRRDPQRHKRLMLLATINLVGAAVARWPSVFALGPLGFFGISDLFLVPLVVWDLRTRGKLHPVTLWGGLLMIASQPLRLLVGGTDGWLAFARWATGLLG